MTILNLKETTFQNGKFKARADLLIDQKVDKSELPDTVTWHEKEYVLDAGSTVITPKFELIMMGENDWGDWNA